MRRLLILAGTMLLAGCSVEQRVDNAAEADIDAAAETAQGDIDTYAANVLQAAPATEAVLKAAPAKPASVQTLAQRTAPPSSTLALADQPVADDDAADPGYRCAGETRQSVRDEEGVDREREDHATADHRLASGVWTKASSDELRTDRAAGAAHDLPRCSPE